MKEVGTMAHNYTRILYSIFLFLIFINCDKNVEDSQDFVPEIITSSESRIVVTDPYDFEIKNKSTYIFASQSVNHGIGWPLFVYNDSTEKLNFTANLFLSGSSYFYIGSNQLYEYTKILPYDEKYVYIHFECGTKLGTYSSVLQMYTDDPVYPIFTINFQGTCTP